MMNISLLSMIHKLEREVRCHLCDDLYGFRIKENLDCLLSRIKETEYEAIKLSDFINVDINLGNGSGFDSKDIFNKCGFFIKEYDHINNCDIDCGYIDEYIVESKDVLSDEYIGDISNSISNKCRDQLRLYRSGLSRRLEDGSYNINTVSGDEFNEFYTYLEKENIINIKSVMLKNGKNYVNISSKKYFTCNNNIDVIVNVIVVNDRKNKIVKGHWMNAFVYNVIKDHLEKNKVNFSIYKNVIYRAPVDVMCSEGDFDVLVGIGDSIICIECKSGILNGSTVKKIIKKSDDINKVINKFTSIDKKIKCYLVYDDNINSEKTMSNRVEGTSVNAVKIEDVRSRLASEIIMEDLCVSSKFSRASS